MLLWANFVGQYFRYVGGYSDLVLAFASSYWITHSMFWGSALLNSSCRLIVPKFDLDTVWYTISTFKVSKQIQLKSRFRINKCCSFIANVNLYGAESSGGFI